MRFVKMHGLGNDYVYVDCFDQEVGDPPALAKVISDRHFGVGPVPPVVDSGLGRVKLRSVHQRPGYRCPSRISRHFHFMKTCAS